MILALQLSLTGCVPNRIYRPGPDAVQNPPTINGVPADFKLGIIEFDDMGEFWEKCGALTGAPSCQMTRVLQLIRDQKKNGDVVVVVFTHGWKNNASRYNEKKKNLRDFKEVMQRLATGEDARLSKLRAETAAGMPKIGKRTYIGVYLGWRGQVIRGNILSTFWNRRDAAQRVGSSDFAEALYRIMAATKENSIQSKVVVVGHSFGARAVETALTNTFVSLLIPRPEIHGAEAAQAQPSPAADEGRLDPTTISPADLILYVNAATDSFRTKQMIELMKRTEFGVTRGAAYPCGPLFLSVTSTGDQATKLAFPLGQGITALNRAFRGSYNTTTDDPSVVQPCAESGAANPLPTPSQKTFFTQTPGHIPFLLSHTVNQYEGPCQPSNELFRFQADQKCFVMQPSTRRWNNSPYWVVTVPPAIIKDHSDIFNRSFVSMIIQLLDRYDVLASPAPTMMVQKK